MGSGIAQVLARRGDAVRVREPTEKLAEAARERTLDGSYGLNDAVEGGYLTPDERDDTFDRIECTTDLEAAVGGTDALIEAVTEDLATKGEVFRAHRSDAAFFRSRSDYGARRDRPCVRNRRRGRRVRRIARRRLR